MYEPNHSRYHRHEAAGAGRDFWHRFLEITGRYDFLQALGERPPQYRWADTALRAIQISDYTLHEMLYHRIAADPERVLFQDMSGSEPVLWNYRLIGQRLEAMAGVFYRTHPEPRVAIMSNNNIDGACCDLACLMFDILDTPSNFFSTRS